MIREEQLDDDKILETLRKDPIGRNQQLNTFIDLLNSINKNSILTIDGEWGSGKTVFVKQIDYLNRTSDVSQLSFLNQDTIESFQDNYEVYYFNAWENDYHDDPLQSILFSLINDVWGASERAADLVVKNSQGLIKSVLKTITIGMYNPEEIRKAGSVSDLTRSITTAAERKQAIDDIISNYLDLKGKKLLFVIDELDRCKPTYAVNLLEVIKHYYINDKMVFLLSTNNRQLAHTIKKVYGQTFDGGGYLNKFYDLIFNLPGIESDKYIEYLGFRPKDGPWKDAAPFEVVNYLNLSIRQINRYYSSLSLIKQYFESSDIFSDRELSTQLVKFVLIPLAYGLRIKDSEDYTRFVDGEGVDILQKFYDKSDRLKTIIDRTPLGGGVANPRTTLEDIYNKLFDSNLSYDHENRYLHQSRETFRKTALLMNASGTIDQPEKLNEN